MEVRPSRGANDFAPPPPVAQAAPSVPRPAVLTNNGQKYMKALESPCRHCIPIVPLSRIALRRSQSTLSSPSLGETPPPVPPEFVLLFPYTVTAGNVIPALLVSGINSDLLGPIIAQARKRFDSATGRYLLVPQGTKLLGSYQNASAYGQQRVQIAWQRLIFLTLPASTSPDAGQSERLHGILRSSRPSLPAHLRHRS